MSKDETIAGRAAAIAARIESFVRDVVVPYESDPRRGSHVATNFEAVFSGLERPGAVV